MELNLCKSICIVGNEFLSDNGNLFEQTLMEEYMMQTIKFNMKMKIMKAANAERRMANSNGNQV